MASRPTRRKTHLQILRITSLAVVVDSIALTGFANNRRTQSHVISTEANHAFVSSAVK
jgi:hypothetical protein